MSNFQSWSCKPDFSQVKCPLFSTFNMRNIIFSASRKLNGFHTITSLFQTSHFVYYFCCHHSDQSNLFVFNRILSDINIWDSRGKKYFFMKGLSTRLFREDVVKKRSNALENFPDYSAFFHVDWKLLLGEKIAKLTHFFFFKAQQ